MNKTPDNDSVSILLREACEAVLTARGQYKEAVVEGDRAKEELDDAKHDIAIKADVLLKAQAALAKLLSESDILLEYQEQIEEEKELQAVYTE